VKVSERKNIGRKNCEFTNFTDLFKTLFTDIFYRYLLLNPPPPSHHRPLGLIQKLIEPHFLTHPTLTTWSAPKRQPLGLTPLALRVKGKHPYFSK
jgi:hypothetical protein